MTRTQDKDVVPFKLLMGRDNLYQRMHGLPKHSKEELKQMSKKYKNKVDFKEFLPNSLVNSPMKKLHSHSRRTESLQLYGRKRHSSYSNMNSTTLQLDEHIKVQDSNYVKTAYGSTRPSIFIDATAIELSGHALSELNSPVFREKKDSTGREYASQISASMHHKTEIAFYKSTQTDRKKTAQTPFRVKGINSKTDRKRGSDGFASTRVGDITEVTSQENLNETTCLSMNPLMFDVDPSINENKHFNKLETKLLEEKREIRMK